MKYSTKPKNEQTKPKRPKKPLVVEPNFSLYLTGKDYKPSQLHVNKKRTISNVSDFFETIQYLYKSKLLDQEWKDQAFPESMILEFQKLFSQYDVELTDIEEHNKEIINFNAIRQGLSYLKQKYSEVALISKQVNEFEALIDMMEVVAQRKLEESKATTFYKMRGKTNLPPELHQYENQYVVMCKICWEHRVTDDKTNLKQTISKIRHKKHCLYDKKQLARCIEIVLPKNASNIFQTLSIENIV